ncbi:MAG: caspase family protein [Pseudomonadota bacterium]
MAVSALPAYAARKALVVGINDYAHVSKLDKAVNDARAMSAALRSIGFDVLTVEDATRRQLNRALLDFTSKLNAGDDALFFFAGHGVEIDGRNYLLPTDVPDAAPGQDSFVKGETIAADAVLEAIRKREARVSILVLDACRNNPFQQLGTRSLGGRRGLARQIAPEGTFIMYSAGVGQTALDALSEDDPHPNSVFTRSLIPLLKNPGLSLTQTARLVRRDVQRIAATVSHNQRPAYYDEVTGDFVFTRGPKRQTSQQSAACRIWPQISRSAGEAEISSFLQSCPTGVFHALARARLREISTEKHASLTPGGTSLTHSATGIGRSAPRHACDRLAASNGDVNAVTAGVLFQQIDSARAIKACRDAVKQWPEEARFSYQLGRALDKAEENVEALVHYRRAAAFRYAAAINSIGTMHEYGESVPSNRTRAIEFYEQAAELGDGNGLYNLARAYETGDGKAQSFQRAAKLYREAAQQGQADAMYAYGLLIDRGSLGSKDPAKALAWYKRAAAQDQSDASYAIGLMYHDGTGVTRDYSTAHSWFRRAAEQSHANAMYMIGRDLENGYGVSKSSRAAAVWISKSLAAGGQFTATSLVKERALWGRNFWRELQRELRKSGHYSGRIDGQPGPSTIAAVRAALRTD